MRSGCGKTSVQQAGGYKRRDEPERRLPFVREVSVHFWPCSMTAGEHVHCLIDVVAHCKQAMRVQ